MRGVVPGPDATSLCRKMLNDKTTSQKVRFGCWALLLVLVFFSGCQDNLSVRPFRGELPPPPPVVTPAEGLGTFFSDVTESSGIDFAQSPGDEEVNHDLEAMGSGAVFFDYDQDGWVDIYLATGKYVEGVSHGAVPWSIPRNRLYRNLGNGVFEDTSDRAGVAADQSYSFGVSSADFNNDHYPDLFVGNYGRSTLFRNDGGVEFTDITEQAGLALEGQCAISSAWLDFNNDGKVDLLVNTFLPDMRPEDLIRAWEDPKRAAGPRRFRLYLFQNLGRSRFEDVSQAMGLASIHLAGEHVGATDLDLDGFEDILVGGLEAGPILFRNQAGTSFSQETLPLKAEEDSNGGSERVTHQTAIWQAGLGGGTSAKFPSTTPASRSEADALLQPALDQVGLNNGAVSIRLDFDNDGDLDVLNVKSSDSRLQPATDQLLENLGNSQYRDVSAVSGPYFHQAMCGRSAISADYDKDGDLDLLVMNYNGPATLLRNDGGNRQNWISIKLEGRTSNHDGLGTHITATFGNNVQRAFRHTSNSPLSQSDARIHFGIGHASVVDKIEIDWPSGIQQILERVPANQNIILVEPTD